MKTIVLSDLLDSNVSFNDIKAKGGDKINEVGTPDVSFDASSKTFIFNNLKGVKGDSYTENLIDDITERTYNYGTPVEFSVNYDNLKKNTKYLISVFTDQTGLTGSVSFAGTTTSLIEWGGGINKRYNTLQQQEQVK